MDEDDLDDGEEGVSDCPPNSEEEAPDDMHLGENDGMMQPADLEQAQFDPPESDSNSSGSSMEDYDGEENLESDEELQPKAPVDSANQEAPAASTPSHQRMFHLSPEWLELGTRGVHLQRVPPVVGCGINHHPAKSFWSCRYPGRPACTATWNESRTPLRCLVLCLKHICKLHIETKPPDADFWRYHLEELGNVEC